MASRRDYENVVRRARRTQISWTKTSVKRLDGILRNAAKETSDRLKAVTGKDSIEERYLAGLLSDLNKMLDNLKVHYSNLLQVSLLGAAQIAADREGNTATLALKDAALQAALDGLKAEITKTVDIGIGNVSVEFGRVSEQAVNAIYNRVYKDGLTLSDRLWRLDSGIRKEMADKVTQAVTQGKSARKLARELQSYLIESGTGNARYNAMRLAVTEINNAHREGHIQSCLDAEGKLKSYISAIGFRLSASHPEPDVCDAWASDDSDGLGSGNYLPDNVPIDHPHGLCYSVSILVNNPELQFVTKEPKPDDVPESQRKYYGL